MSSVSISWRALFPYLFILFLIYLAGIFVAPFFTFLYYFILGIPLLSLVQLAVALGRLRYYQHFDSEHPTKGESIGYRLALSNESLLATGPVRVEFMTVHPELQENLRDLTLSFPGNAHIERRYTIRCPYRGIYTVGLNALVVSDLLGWLRVRRMAYHRTFYVFPRVIELLPPFVGSAIGGLSAVITVGAESDTTLFEGLTGYRQGLPIKHMAWKKFQQTGEPVLRLFGRSSQPGITIYLDLRRSAVVSPELLATEDCSIEIAVALVKYFLDCRIPVTVKAMGHELYLFHGSDPERFAEFHRHTINLLFGLVQSPAELFLSDRKSSGGGGAALFVTHLPDPELLDLVVGDGSEMIAAIVNVSSFSAAERGQYEGYFDSIRERGGRLLLVRNPDTIREDLEA